MKQLKFKIRDPLQLRIPCRKSRTALAPVLPKPHVLMIISYLFL